MKYLIAFLPLLILIPHSGFVYSNAGMAEGTGSPITSGVAPSVNAIASLIEESTKEPVYRIITAYTLSPDETDDTPEVGAYGDNLKELSKTATICATRAYPKNTHLKVGAIECVVLDKTSKKYADRIDVLMPNKEEAFKFGKQVLPVEIQ